MTTIFMRDFPKDLHHEAKVQAAIEGISLKALVEKALKEYLKTARKKGGK